MFHQTFNGKRWCKTRAGHAPSRSPEKQLRRAHSRVRPQPTVDSESRSAFVDHSHSFSRSLSERVIRAFWRRPPSDACKLNACFGCRFWNIYSCSRRIIAFQSQEIRIFTWSFVISNLFYEKRGEMPDVVVLTVLKCHYRTSYVLLYLQLPFCLYQNDPLLLYIYFIYNISDELCFSVLEKLTGAAYY